VTIGETIRQLLEEKKRVILPGFGNLEVKESGDTFPTSSKRIEPPGLSVRFDSTYSKDDGLLAAALAEGAGIDREEAGQQVLELVDAIKFALDKGETYAMAGTGTFSRDDDGRVRFQADPGWVLEPEQYGLGSLDLLELEDLPEEEAAEAGGEPGKDEQPQPDAGQEEPVPAEAGQKEAGQKEPAEKAPVPPKPAGYQPTAPRHEPWKREKQPRRVSNLWRVIWIVAGCLIVVLAVLIFVPAERFNIFRPGDGGTTEAPVEETVAEPGSGEVAGPGETPAAEQEEAPVAEREAAAGQEPVGPANAATDNYFIIAGSFRHLGYASELQDKLKARGYPAEIMITANRMYRVSVASYATKEEAEKGLSGVKSEPGLEACWLLSN
jgi:cell division protein FtsN/nucleoid DNA-binding protein